MEETSSAAADDEMCRELEHCHLSSSERRRSWLSTFHPGERVARRYRIERLLARGGMGEVYVAVDEPAGTRVALKTLRSVAADDPAAIHALRNEYELASRIEHPNVCRVRDVDVHAEDPRDIVHFLTMDLIDGETLAARLERRCVSLAEALHISRQLLGGLAAVHRAGVLHRDVKSHNILLAGQHPSRVLLSDFGLARPLDALGWAEGRPASGSPVYMAPEQIAGAALCPATDLFAFGVLFFEMCVGRLPFDRPGQQASRFELDTLLRALHGPALPSGLVRFLSGCLCYSAAGRYPSASAALLAFDGCVTVA